MVFRCPRGMIRVIILVLSVACATGERLTVAQVRVDAVAGSPFGVAEISFSPGPERSALAATDAWMIRDGTGRVLYPAVKGAPLRALLSSVTGRDEDMGPVTILFLFRGTDGFDITVDTGTPTRVHVQPRLSAPFVLRRSIAQWWRAHQRQAGEWSGDESLAPLSDYTGMMLADRLGLRSPEVDPRGLLSGPEAGWQTLRVLLGTPDVRGVIRRDSLSPSSLRRQVADQPLPAALSWQAPYWGEGLDVEVEPIARRVPAESFYIRFGSFENYLWLRRLSESFEGDLGRMVGPVSIRRNAEHRIEQQLGVASSGWSSVLGPTVIADMALIGTDFYLSEGAALGILFQARHAILGTDLMQKRRAALQALRSAGATEETIRIAGHDVSFIKTPDNRLRSLYVSDGEFHLISNSKALVRRFLEVAAGPGSLGASVEFQRARQRMPLERQDTIFIYLSTPFLQGLVSPAYQIEQWRRLRAATDIELIQLARWAARAEGKTAESVAELVEQGCLPPHMMVRPEGGRIEWRGETWMDSERGARGVFEPIPDRPPERVTRAEREWYERHAAYYRAHWKHFDPLMIGVRRFAVQAGSRERLSIEAHLSPLDESKYGWLFSILGEPSRMRVHAPAGELMTLQAHVQGGLLDPSVPPHTLFVGLADERAPAGGNDWMSWLRIASAAPIYVGATPKLGFLDRLPRIFGTGSADADGYSSLPLGWTRREWADYSVMSPRRDILERVTPELFSEEAAQPAQLRCYIGDLSASQLRPWLEELARQRALEASRGNARMVHRLAEQLRIPRDEAWRAAEVLRDGTLVCPLAGEYVLRETAGGTSYWVSTAWETESGQGGFEAPLLRWFRGMNADLLRTADGVIVRAEIDVEGLTPAASSPLPLFDLFRGTRPSAAPDPAAPRRQRF